VRDDFSGFDFPDNSLSRRKAQTANGWELEWNYQNLVSASNRLKMPQKLQPVRWGADQLFRAVSRSSFSFWCHAVTLRGTTCIDELFLPGVRVLRFSSAVAYLADHISIHRPLRFRRWFRLGWWSVIAAGGGFAFALVMRADATDLSGVFS